MKTEDVLASMFKENTGKRMTDSGDYYGRQYERHANKSVADFMAAPGASFDIYLPRGAEDGVGIELSVRFDTFQWLMKRVEFDPAMDAEFQACLQDRSKTDSSDLATMKHWAHVKRDDEDRFYTVSTSNTYNDGACCLDQTLQWVSFSNASGYYLILQVHGGCDVMHGYTRPRVFSYGGDSEMFEYDRYTIEAGNADGTVYTRWHSEMAPEHTGSDDKRYLEDFNFIVTDDEVIGAGLMRISADRKHAFCPITGGELTAWPPLKERNKT